MRMQTEAAVAAADVALFLIDARAGVTPLDEEIARWLRGSKTPVFVVANKTEGRAAEPGVLETYALGFGEPVPISAEHGQGMADLFQALLPHLELEEENAPAAEDDAELAVAVLTLSIFRRPIAGNSTLLPVYLPIPARSLARTRALLP